MKKEFENTDLFTDPLRFSLDSQLVIDSGIIPAAPQ